jgi:hypothetical protein
MYRYFCNKNSEPSGPNRGTRSSVAHNRVQISVCVISFVVKSGDLCARPSYFLSFTRKSQFSAVQPGAFMTLDRVVYISPQKFRVNNSKLGNPKVLRHFMLPSLLTMIIISEYISSTYPPHCSPDLSHTVEFYLHFN